MNATALRCRLPASGFTETLNEVYDWAQATVAEIKKRLDGKPIEVNVWAYREQGGEFLAADFLNAEEQNPRRNYYPITFFIVGSHDFRLEETGVPDMTEALHMVGIVADALGAKISIGRLCNEVNRYCTPEPWKEGQTNGVIALP